MPCPPRGTPYTHAKYQTPRPHLVSRPIQTSIWLVVGSWDTRPGMTLALLLFLPPIRRHRQASTPQTPTLPTEPPAPLTSPSPLSLLAAVLYAIRRTLPYTSTWASACRARWHHCCHADSCSVRDSGHGQPGHTTACPLGDGDVSSYREFHTTGAVSDMEDHQGPGAAG